MALREFDILDEVAGAQGGPADRLLEGRALSPWSLPGSSAFRFSSIADKAGTCRLMLCPSESFFSLDEATCERGKPSPGSFGSFGSLACEEDLTWKMPLLS